MRQCPFIGKLNGRSVRHGVGEGHPQLDQIRPGRHHGVHQRDRHGGLRIAGGDERNQRLAPLSAQQLESLSDAAHTSIPSSAATVWMSLSPRPERLTTRMASRSISGASFAAKASAWLDSSAGMIPSIRVRA